MIGRTRWTAVLASAVLAGFAFAACETVGRSLVETIPEGGEDDLRCTPFECTEITMPSSTPITAADTSPNLDLCQTPSRDRCDPVTETGPSPVRGRLGTCVSTHAIDDGRFDPDAVRSLTCMRLRLQSTQPNADGVLRIEGVTWSRVELEVESSQPFTLELAGAALDRVQVQLRGPITFRLVDGQALSGVALAAESPSASVEFRASDATKLGIGDASGSFAGRVHMTRTTVKVAQLYAREIALETVGIQDARLEAERVRFVDVTSRGLDLAFREAVLSASRLTQTDVESCGALGVYGSTVLGYRIPACSDAETRLVSSSFSRGSVDGDLLVDDAKFERGLFGLNEPTDLQLWDVGLVDTNFCSNTDRVVIAGKTSAVCGLCREMDGSRVSVDPCVHEEADPNFLKCCVALDEAPVCSPPPERMRPPFN